MKLATLSFCSPSALVTSCSPTCTRILALGRTLQWAAVRTVLELSKVPPQNGVTEPVWTKATSHGYSFFTAGCPPTMRFLLTWGTPHLQLLGGAVVGGGVGAGVGGLVGLVGLGGLGLPVRHPEHPWNSIVTISMYLFITV